MFDTIDSYFKEKSILYITCASIIITVIIGALDYVTGYELYLSIFYIIPVYIGSWYASNNVGILLCCLTTVTWFGANYFAGQNFSYSTVFYWNLVVRVSFFVLISYLFSNLRTNYDKEKNLSSTDGLTGVTNLRVFKETSEALFKISKRTRCSVSICYIDVDNFKNLNDTHGHDEGDRVLKVIGATLKSCVRKSDLVGRLGGDEFSVLLYDTDLDGAKVVGDRMLEQLCMKTKNAKSPIGYSIGIAVFGSAPSSAQEAIKRSDALMYRAKNTGKNRIIIERAA